MIAHSNQSILISVDDLSLRIYLQEYPFATGPDKGMNEKALSAIRESFQKRPSCADMSIALVAPEKTEIDAVAAGRAASIFTSIGVGEPEQRKLMNDFGWRVNRIPKDTGNILSIGCGEGQELVFIRAVFPQIRITALDYRQSLLPGLADAVGLDFIEGDFNKELCKLAKESYQAIFSNHTLEHMYDPDATIKHLARVLKPGGCIVSGIPLDGSIDGVFQDKVRFLSEHPNRIHAVDSILLDFGIHGRRIQGTYEIHYRELDSRGLKYINAMVIFAVNFVGQDGSIASCAESAYF